jgi:hypothetical protein
MPRGRPRIEINPVLLHSGLPAMRIAELAGVSADTVLSRLREEGIPVRSRGQRGKDRRRRRAGSGTWDRGMPKWMIDGIRPSEG